MKVENYRECICHKKCCKWYKGLRANGNPYCFAFPKGIPDDILDGTNPHKGPHPKQNKDYVYQVGSNPCLLKIYHSRHMDRPSVHGHDTLCSTIKDIWMRTDDPQIKFWCQIAMAMSKNMYKACQLYKNELIKMGVKVNHDTREQWQLEGTIKKEEEKK